MSWGVRREIPRNIIAESREEEAEPRYLPARVADTTRNTRGDCDTMYEINSLGFRGIGTGAPRPAGTGCCVMTGYKRSNYGCPLRLRIVYDPDPDLDLSIFICGQLRVYGLSLLRPKILTIPAVTVPSRKVARL